MSDQIHTTTDIHQEKVSAAHIVAYLFCKTGTVDRRLDALQEEKGA